MTSINEQRGTGFVLAAGVGLAVAAAALVFVWPQRTDLVFYIQSSGSNEVHLPVGYAVVSLLWLFVVAWAAQLAVRALAPRAALVTFATHILLLLAALTPIVRTPDAFTTPLYLAYTRLFCAAVLVGAIAWSLQIASEWRSVKGAMAIPIVLATAIFAFLLFLVDPGAAVVALAAGSMLRRLDGRLAQALAPVRGWLADDRAFMLVIFIAAVALRLLYLQRVMSNPGYVETGADGPVYDELAWSIAQGHGIRATFTERFPLLLLGYVWFVSAIYGVAGHSYFAVGAIQAVIGGAACVLFYSIAKELCGRTIARTAAVFAVISFPLLFAAAAIGHQAIDVFLTMAIVWVLVKGAPPAEWPWWRWCAVGVLFGIAIAVRETVTFFLAFVLLWIPFRFARPLSARAIGAAALVLFTAIATIAPLAIPKVSTVAERDKLRHHFDILYRGEADPIRLRDDIVAPLSNPGAAMTQLLDSPAMVLGTLARAWGANFGLQFFAQPYGGFDLIFLRKGTAYFYTLWFYVYALTVAGAIVLVRRLRIDAHAAGMVLVLGLIASRTVPHIILESNYRHRVPIEPFLILLASVGVVQLMLAARRDAQLSWG